MDLTNLNDKQRQAVEQTEGAVLILAGAGSGKTKTLTQRAAHIVRDLGVDPYRVLCITFTNKAASEMKSRIERLIGEDAQGMWVCTFHSMCTRILYIEAERIGYQKSFTIYDTDDTQKLIKKCLKELDMDEKYFKPRTVAEVISQAKNKMMGPNDMRRAFQGDLYKEKVADVYERYEEEMFRNNAMDFDNLLIKCVELFQNCPDVLDKYARRFSYIHVDEYQDTNHAQYLLVKMLASCHRNLCVVGDDDQSIYGWRGADIQNILDFEEDFPEATVIRLERNYRSQEKILNAANAVISHNTERKGKTLWTDKKGGEDVEVYRAITEHAEADYVAQNIQEMVGEYRFSDFACLYRLNAQSRVIEETFLQRGIPYRVLGGMKFYDRREVKDVVAYFRVVENPDDDVSLFRIINVPKRGIGETTVAKIAAAAANHNISAYDVIQDAEQYLSAPGVVKKLENFARMMARMRAQRELLEPTELVRVILQESQIAEVYRAGGTDEDLSRAENVMELISAADDYFEHAEEGATLSDFLHNVALVMDTDHLEEDTSAVTLMTLHSAKGLEFPVVFLMGMEESIFPHFRAFTNEKEMQEERRLCYVGITRAMDKLFLTYAVSRGMFGNTTYNPPSRFLSELPEEGVRRNDAASARSAILWDDQPKPKEKLVFEYARTPKIAHSKTAEQNSGLSAGDKVEHPIFGDGTILSVTGAKDNAIAEIAFDGQGIKRIALKFVALKKV